MAAQLRQSQPRSLPRDPDRANISYENYFAKRRDCQRCRLLQAGGQLRGDTRTYRPRWPTISAARYRQRDHAGQCRARQDRRPRARACNTRLTVAYTCPWLQGLGLCRQLHARGLAIGPENDLFRSDADPRRLAPCCYRHAVLRALGFNGARVVHWRSTALNDGIGGSTFTFGGKTYEVFQAPYGQVDLQLGYNISRQARLRLLGAEHHRRGAAYLFAILQTSHYTYDDSGRQVLPGGEVQALRSSGRTGVMRHDTQPSHPQVW